MTETAIFAKQLNKVYSDGLFQKRKYQALSDVQFHVPRGDVFGLLGPNGAGKTTFIKILLGIIRKTSGEAQVMGCPAGSREARRLVGYLPEQMRVPRHLTGRGALAYYGCLNGVARRDLDQRIPELLDLVGLGKRGGDLTRKYSKGMVQRLGLAQALIHRPPLLILDEPTDGLDPKARAEMRQILLRLKDEGVTVFLNSHILQEVEMVCDHVAILHEGQVRFSGAVAEIGRQLRGDSTNVTPGFEVHLRVQGDVQRVQAAMAPGVQVESGADRVSDIRCEVADQEEVDAMVDRIRSAGLSLLQLERKRVSLEDAFLSIISQPGEFADFSTDEVSS